MKRHAPPDPLDGDDPFAALLARYDEQLASGATLDRRDDSSLPDERTGRRLAEAQSFLRLVESVWPRGEHPALPDSADIAADADDAPDGPARAESAAAAPDVDRSTDRAGRSDQVAASGGPAVPGDLDNSMLGRFRLLREAGHGGCGLVFQALDTVTGRHVALKVPRPEALISPELKQRFLQEARAAAALSHPHITAVYEAGQVGAVCYIASAWCDGPNLAEWLRQQTRPVSIRTAARIVMLLADAVQHAHSRGVLHRDLKPANVLLEPRDAAAVTLLAEPVEPLDFVPRLTDFGLAKLLEAEEHATRSGALMGTPAYMAPEQADGQRARIGPTTDVYALGVLLYELLTGRLPHQGRGEADTLRRIVDEPPTDPRRLRREIDRDLSAIVVRCLEKQPAHRYASAAALGDDLFRYLSGEPVLARPVPAAVRLWRWSRRRPVSAAMSAALLVAVVAGVGGIAWQWQRAEQNHRRSLESLAQAHQIINNLYPIGDHITWDVRDPDLQGTLKMQFLRHYEELLTIEADDPLVALELADTHRRYAALLDAVGRRDEANQAFDKAIARWRALGASAALSPTVARGLAETLILAARTRRISGDPQAAWTMLIEAEALLEELRAGTPDDASLEHSLATCLLFQGKCKHRLGDIEAATDALLRAAAIGEALTAREPAELAARYRLLRVLDDLVIVLGEADRQSDALRTCRQIIEQVERLERDFPDIGGFDASLATCVRAAARYWEQAGYLHEAVEANEVAIRYFEARRRHDREHFRDAVPLVTARLAIARLARRLDEPALGEKHLDHALDLAAGVAASPHHASYDVRRLSGLLATLATELIERERLEDVDVVLQLGTAMRARADFDRAVPLEDYHVFYGNLYYSLGDVAAKRGDEESELHYYRLAAEAYEPLLSQHGVDRRYHVKAAEARYWCGHTQREFGQWFEAQQSYDQAISTLLRFLEEQPADRYARGLLARAHHFQAAVYESLDQPSQAAEHHRRAIDLFEPLVADHLASEAGFIENLDHSRRQLAKLQGRT